MEEAAAKTSETIKRPAWTKRHQTSIAILGAVLATTTYFGKDHAQEHYKGLATAIKAARASDDAVRNQAGLDQRIATLIDDVDALNKDALAFERNEKPHAQSDRLDSTRGASLSSRNNSVTAILRKCQLRLASLSAMDEATSAASPHRDELNRMRQDVETKLATTRKFAISSIPLDVSLFGFNPLQRSAAQQNADNSTMDLLERQTDDLEQRTFDLATTIREDAAKQQERYSRYEERTTLFLSVVFVVGLLLSLVGKLSGGDAEPVGGE